MPSGYYLVPTGLHFLGNIIVHAELVLATFAAGLHFLEHIIIVYDGERNRK